MNSDDSAPGAAGNRDDDNQRRMAMAREGRYRFSIEAVFAEARALAHGYKWRLNIAVSIYVVITMLMALLVAGLQAVAPGSVLLAIIGELIHAWVTLPIAMGLFVITLDRSGGGEVDNDPLFRFFSFAPQLLIAAILMTLFIFVGYVLLIVPGIYLSVAYLFALPLVVEKRMRFLEALETSRKAITGCWFSVFGLLLFLAIVNAVAAIPLGIGLIWSVPWSMLAIAIVYRDMFGVTAPSRATKRKSARRDASGARWVRA